MRTRRTTSKRQSASPALKWTDADREQLCWDAGVLSLVVTQGFKKAVTDALMAENYRLTTISRDKEPFESRFKLSLFVLGDRQRLGRREMKQLVLGVMAKIGLSLKPDDCHVDVAGRKVVASVVLPSWAWPA
jgi:hypothetical protein